MMKEGVCIDLKNKVALVTGASRGIGKATAEKLAEAGCHVVLFSRKTHLLEEVKNRIQSLGSKASVVIGNVGVKEDVERLFDFIENEIGKLDILINNAGISPHFCPFVNSPEKDWHRMIDVNLKGVFYCCYKAFELLKKGEDPAVVNVSSIAGLTGIANIAVYTATKGALTIFTKSLAVEWAPHGIRVNAICPGFISTDMTAGVEANERIREQLLARIPVRRFGKPEEVAQAVLFLVSPLASYITGHCLVVDGGWLAW